MGKAYRADNRYNRRRRDGGRRRTWFYRAKIAAGIAVIGGLLVLQFGPALMDCNARYNSVSRFYSVPGQTLLVNLVKGRRWFCD